MYKNLSLTTADKLGQQYNLGYNDSSLANENTDGSIITIPLAATIGVSTVYSAPLIGLLGWSEKLIPLFFWSEKLTILELLLL